MNELPSSPEKSQWNISQLYILGVYQDALRPAHLFYKSNKVDACFDCLKLARMKLASMLSSDENKSLEDLEPQIEEALRNWIKAKSKIGSAFNNNLKEKLETVETIWKAKKELDKYNTLLLQYMDKYDLLVKRREDKTRIN